MYKYQKNKGKGEIDFCHLDETLGLVGLAVILKVENGWNRELLCQEK